MKQRNLLVSIMALIIVFSSCEKSEPECRLFPAKIIRYNCDRVIFQLLTNEFVGDSNWLDVETGQQYSNVVSYYNTCKIAELTNGEMVTLYVDPRQSENDPSLPECYQCQAIPQSPPQTKVDFEQISLSPCESSSN